jgi:TRAP-type C4-dicarboxylate transport system substrate-binding protein
MRIARLLLFVWTACLAPASLADEPRVLRMASIAPDGTAWAREAKSFAREIETATAGAVKMKWYFGAIAGDEMSQLDRLKRGQLDGIAGTVYCEQLAPSLTSLEVAGMIDRSEDASKVLKAVQPHVDEEFAATPFRAVFVTLGFGHRVLFSRTPVRSLADLRAGRYWVWSLDTVLRSQLPEMGVHIVPLPLEDAARAYEENKVDGFIVIPAAALAFQYSTVAKYFTDLETGYLPGCLVMSKAALDSLPYKAQLEITAAAAKLKNRFENIGAHMDEQLLGGLFAKQGLKPLPMSTAFRAEWLHAGQAAYHKLNSKLVRGQAARQVLESLEQERTTRR